VPIRVKAVSCEYEYIEIDKWTYKEIWDHEWICSEEGWIRTYWKNEAVEEINNIFQLKI
jgi:hypothetical protein